MSAASLSSRCGSAIIVLTFFNPHGSASDGAIDPLQKYRTRQDIHGLYEIREAARQVIATENRKNNTKWEAMDPDLRVQVTRCAVPLKVTWASKSHGLANSSLEVQCSRTIKPKIEKKWRVFVPIFQGQVIQN